MIVTFCGHGDTDARGAVADATAAAVEALLLEGARTFYLGGYGSFDSLAARIIREKKSGCPDLRSVLILAYPDRAVTDGLYDETLYPPLETVPRRYAISRRNEWMVDQADVVVSCVTRGWGGAAAMLSYAVRKKKRVVSVADSMI